MFIKSIKIENLLSFGPDTQELALGPLNVLIGPNGSGKSNLVEAVGLLQAAPRDMKVPIRKSGGISQWMWRGEPKASSAGIEAILEGSQGAQALRYSVGFAEQGQRFELVEERLENEHPYPGHPKPYIYYELRGNRATLNYRDSEQRQRELRIEETDPEQSILAQRKDPDHYPELTWLGDEFSRMRLYREWSFGRYTPPRLPQVADRPNDFLDDDGGNLGLVLNRLRTEPEVKRRILRALRDLYEGVADFGISMEGGTVQVFLEENDVAMPATRLSDGTLRFLCLLAILCHPTPPPLVCIEEPELGLHPDVLPGLADLLREASERCQLVVTTHSDVIVDKLTDAPESVVVFEKEDGRTKMKRLDGRELAVWLERYSLGDLWTRGELGGNRW